VEVAWTDEAPREEVQPAPPEPPPQEDEPRLADHAAPAPAPAPETPAPMPLAVTLDLPDLPPLTVDPAASLEGLDLSALPVRPGSPVTAPDAGRGAATGPMTDRGVDVPPVKTHAPRPAFPRRALRRRIHEGRVEAMLLVDREGRVARVRITSASPRGYFESAVRRAVATWTFRPARYRDRAVACWCRQTFHFQVE
jgi:TonB family protein